MQDGVDLLHKLNLYRHEVKRRISMAEDYFNKYNQCTKWLFDYCEDDAKALLCGDLEVLRDACDHFMGATVRTTEYRYCNDENLRQKGEYLCRVEGAKDAHTLVLRWDNWSRQWQQYNASQYGAGWVALMPGVKVVEVLQTVKPKKED